LLFTGITLLTEQMFRPQPFLTVPLTYNSAIPTARMTPNKRKA
jgi:hypothetical protein